MRAGDFVLCTFAGDPAGALSMYALEITSIDWRNEFFSCRRSDREQRFNFRFSSGTGGSWPGSDDQGRPCELVRHDIYTPAASDPAAGHLAVVTFPDGRRCLCSVQAISPQTEMTLYNPPYARLSVDFRQITRSEWDRYPAGGEIAHIERFVSSQEIEPPTFNNGWWSLARRLPAFAGRIGAAIQPFATVVHTTDMTPESWDGLLHSWTTQVGSGACAHFLIGRHSGQGVVQLAPVTRNANHAGGPGHGSFVAGAQSFHPNNVSVGIEVHCAGSVRQVGGLWRLVENGVPQGAALADAEVVPDPQRPGRGWHVVTDYQYQQLGELLDGLEAVLGALPAGCVARSIEPPPPYGRFATARAVGHVSLHAAQRGDPWPQTCEWMRARN
jgi:hypothetical protein